MRTIIYILILFINNCLCFSQAYENLNESSGIDTSGTQLNLKLIAANLKSAFPSAFQSEFKVYSVGFYLHNEDFKGGTTNIFQNYQEYVQNESPYYLFIGRQYNEKQVIKKYWIDLRLPVSDPFDCIGESVRVLISNLIEVEIIKSSTHEYVINERVAMEKMREIVLSILNNDCLIISNNLIPDILRSDGFRAIPIFIPPPGIESNDKNDRNAMSLVEDYANIEFIIEGETIDLYSDFTEIMNEISGKCFVTKNSSITNSNIIADIKDEFNSEGDNIWFHIYKAETQNEQDSLFIKWKTTSIGDDNLFGLGYLFDLKSENYFYNSKGEDNSWYIVDMDGDINKSVYSPEMKITIKNFNTNTIIRSLKVNDPVVDKGYANEWVKFRQFPPEPSCPSCTVDCEGEPFLYSITNSMIDGYYASIPGLTFKPFFVRHFFAYKNSSGEQDMDFTYDTLLDPFFLSCGEEALRLGVPQDGGPSQISHFYLHYEASNDIVYNVFDFGNYLWGGAMEILGFSVSEARYFANYNSKNTGFGEDTPADQRAITNGYLYIN